MNEKDKNGLNLISYLLILVGIIVLSCAAHLNFFLTDGRPFLDHDWHYFDIGYFKFFEIVYGFVVGFLPSSWHNGIFIYKMLNLLYLIPLIVFTCLSVTYIYGRALGLVSAFFIATTPAVLNVFHQSDINLQTVALLSLLLYVYLRAGVFRSLFFSLFFFLTLFVFYLHHYSSVLFLGAFFPSILYCLFMQVRHKIFNIRNVLIGCLFFTLLLVVDMYLNQNRYILFINVLDNYYLNSHKFCSEKLISVFLYMFKNIRANFLGIIMQGVHYLNIHTAVSLLLLVVNFVCLLYAFLKKRKFQGYRFVETQLVLFILSFFIMLAFEPNFPIDVFFAPMFVVLTFLNVAAISKLASWLKSRCFLKGGYFFAVFCFFVYGETLLFFPDLFLRQQEAELYCYTPVEDDFNLNEHVDFFASNDIDLSEVLVIGGGDPTDYVPDLYFFSLWLDTKVSLEGVRERDMKHQSAYVVFLYDVQSDTKKSETEYLTPLSARIKSRIERKYKIMDSNMLSLVNIIPYGVLAEVGGSSDGVFYAAPLYEKKYVSQRENLATDRRYLAFIFHLEGARGFNLRRFL